MRKLILLAVVIAIATGCRSTSHPNTPATTRAVAAPVMSIDDAMKLIDARGPWENHLPTDYPRHPAEKYLKGLVIVLDPGHGGKDHNGKGPTGILEADMNLRVGLLLARLLKDAGADVTLTRSDDSFLELSDRAKIANELHADLFISLHHNSTQSRTTNWSSVWYHGQVDDSEPALDAARFVAINLNKALRTEAGVTAPLFSDQLMYPGGFGVLRACDVPCFLCESSFYSNPTEEARLADAGYNLREAYAIYTGLCEWAQCGRPTQSTPVVSSSESKLKLETTLSEGLPDWWGKDRSRILASSVCVKLNGKEIPHAFDRATKKLTAELPLEKGDKALLEIHFANYLGNHNWPQRFSVELNESGEHPTVKPLGTAPATATTRSLRQ
jgi:N-acetylmuramoyl-L-alanine amidase